MRGILLFIYYFSRRPPFKEIFSVRILKKGGGAFYFLFIDLIQTCHDTRKEWNIGPWNFRENLANRKQNHVHVSLTLSLQKKMCGPMQRHSRRHLMKIVIFSEY